VDSLPKHTQLVRDIAGADLQAPWALSAPGHRAGRALLEGLVGSGTRVPLSYTGKAPYPRRENILTSLWKTTQAETLSTGSRTTTQHRPRSRCTLFIHTETGIFSPLRLTTSTCGYTQAAPRHKVSYRGPLRAAWPSGCHQERPTPMFQHFQVVSLHSPVLYFRNLPAYK
jgi:hypothetical protein